MKGRVVSDLSEDISLVYANFNGNSRANHFYFLSELFRFYKMQHLRSPGGYMRSCKPLQLYPLQEIRVFIYISTQYIRTILRDFLRLMKTGVTKI